MESMLGKNTEIEKLIEIRERYENLITYSDELFCEVDGSGNYTYVSENYKRVLGYDPCELVGRPVRELVHPDDLMAALSKHETIKANKASSVDIWRIKNKAGDYRYFECRGSVFDSNSGDRKTVVIARDVTKERTLKIEKEKSEVHYNSLVNQLNQGVVTLDLNGKVTFCNLAATQLMGEVLYEFFEPPLIVSDLCVFDEEKRPIPRGEFPARLALETSEPIHHKVYGIMNHITKSVHWFDLTILPIYSPTNSDPVGLCATFEDITERKRQVEIEKQILDEIRNTHFEIAQRQYALDQHAIVAITDLNGKITYANQKFIEVSKYSLEEIIGKDHRILNSNYHGKEFFREMYRTLHAGDIWHGEIRNRAKDGELYWVDTTIVPLKNYEGKTYQYIAIRTLIDERKKAEEKIVNLLKEKELLLIEVHHRIKNNMNTIFSLLKFQANSLEDISQRAVLEDAARRVQSMMVLYDKLFRSKNHNQILWKEYLPNLVSEILRTFPKKISLNIFSTDDIILNTDKIAPLSILINELISNTMKYSFTGLPEGMILIESTYRNDRLEITYEDNGIPLPETLSLDHSKGFGLSLISMLVKQLRGEIRIDRSGHPKFVISIEK